QLVENKDRLKRAVNSVFPGGSTALHEAWVRGGLQVSEHLDTDAINRVLLITDGQANVGETSVDRIVEQTRQLASRNVSTSTIGIGQDFNEDLLMPMAEAGQGNSWHVEEPQDMVKIFETELRGLVNQIGHSVTFGIKPAAGVTVAEVLNDFELDASGRYKLPNLQAGSPLDIVVRLRVPAQSEGTTAELAQFSLAYIGQESKLPETVIAVFAGDFASAAEVDLLPENVDVVTAVQLLMNARARREAMAKMDQFDFAGAEMELKMASGTTRNRYSQSPLPALAAEIEDLADLEESLKSRQNDALSRKKMAYRREMLRKGK
ncbi:MAG TPA: VWA domain-containing protein, partial [Pyrinomonadaceae bacterium]|nr:VWA domain-containing protein [Pyrinomonadaceae bacterium]